MPQNTTEKPIIKTKSNFSVGKHLPLNFHNREIMPRAKTNKNKSKEENKKFTSSSTPLLSKPTWENDILGPYKTI